jgi:hypothetical protein
MKQVRVNATKETHLNHTNETKQNENGLAFILAFVVVSALVFLIYQ